MNNSIILAVYNFLCYDFIMRNYVLTLNIQTKSHRLVSFIYLLIKGKKGYRMAIFSFLRSLCRFHPLLIIER